MAKMNNILVDMTVVRILSRPCWTNLENSTINHRKLATTELTTD